MDTASQNVTTFTFSEVFLGILAFSDLEFVGKGIEAFFYWLKKSDEPAKELLEELTFNHSDPPCPRLLDAQHDLINQRLINRDSRGNCHVPKESRETTLLKVESIFSNQQQAVLSRLGSYLRNFETDSCFRKKIQDFWNSKHKRGSR